MFYDYRLIIFSFTFAQFKLTGGLYPLPCHATVLDHLPRAKHCVTEAGVQNWTTFTVVVGFVWFHCLQSALVLRNYCQREVWQSLILQ